MAIFGRRILQSLINSNVNILDKNKLLRHVKCLNKLEEDSLSSEWELVLLEALQHLGEVTYEPDLGGKSKIDIQFKSSTGDKVIADIVTVTDKGYEASNPYESFHNEVVRIIRKHKLAPNRFSIKVQSEIIVLGKEKKIKLLIPLKNKWPEDFKKQFLQFLKDVLSNPVKVVDFIFDKNSIRVHINFNPLRRYLEGNFPSYKIAYSLTNNPVFKALKRKSKQLKGTNYNGLKGIIVCDGGCDMLRQTGYGLQEFSLVDVINDFFRQNSSVSFVFIFSIFRKDTRTYHMGELCINIRYYKNLSAKVQLNKSLKDKILNLSRLMPIPINDARNAINYLNSRFRKEGLSFKGGMRMANNVNNITIKFSVRALLQLLSGQVSQNDFFQYHPEMLNFMRSRVQEGRMIEEIGIEKTKEDDDWVEIKFGKPDPAVSPFTIPG